RSADVERAHDAAVGLDNSITGPRKTGVDTHDPHSRPPEHMYETEFMGRVGPVQGTWECLQLAARCENGATGISLRSSSWWGEASSAGGIPAYAARTQDPTVLVDAAASASSSGS